MRMKSDTTSIQSAWGTEILKQSEPLPIRKSQKFQPWMPWKWCGVRIVSAGIQEQVSAINIPDFIMVDWTGIRSTMMTSAHREKGEPMAEYIEKEAVTRAFTLHDCDSARLMMSLPEPPKEEA